MGADLTAIARGNSPARQAAASKALDADRSGRLPRFRELVAASVLTTNADFKKVLAYDDLGAVIDGRGYRVQQAGGNTAAGLAAFAAAQGAYLVPREEFEDLWEHGRRFIYGAVNAGGTGAEGFGPICLVVADPEGQGPDALGVFPADSLKRYTRPQGTVDEARARAEATAWGDRAELAVIERGHEALAAPEPDWPRVLWGGEGYLEVVFAGRLSLQAVAEARLRTGLRERLDELRARVLLGERLTSVEENEVEAYDALQRWRRRHGIAINDLP